MTDAPERIWVSGDDHTGSWNDHEIDHVQQTEYVRAETAPKLLNRLADC